MRRSAAERRQGKGTSVTCGRGRGPLRSPRSGRVRRIGLRSARAAARGANQGDREADRTKPHTSEYDRLHLEARLEASRREAAASTPASHPPRTQGSEGTASRNAEGAVFGLLLASCRWRTFAGAVLRFEGHPCR
ncbi:hypothetical protein MHU86_8332 [Fragilaria crotonensis]|nr:hypothetical protein MHU86_8332 [Fragilaria crotonensis]